jgi:hypothetical protein
MSLNRFIPEILGYDLPDSLTVQMDLRTAVTERWNPEIIWGNTNSRAVNIQRFAQARMFVAFAQGSRPRGMYAPPLRMAELFYSENGVPIDEDVTWDYNSRYDLRTATQDDRYTHVVYNQERTEDSDLPAASSSRTRTVSPDSELAAVHRPVHAGPSTNQTRTRGQVSEGDSRLDPMAGPATGGGAQLLADLSELTPVSARRIGIGLPTTPALAESPNLC